MLITNNFPRIISISLPCTDFASAMQGVCNSLNPFIGFISSHFCSGNSICLEWLFHICGHLCYPSNAHSVDVSPEILNLITNLIAIPVHWVLKPLLTFIALRWHHVYFLFPLQKSKFLGEAAWHRIKNVNSGAGPTGLKSGLNHLLDMWVC